jgi:hypothetical protein
MKHIFLKINLSIAVIIGCIYGAPTSAAQHLSEEIEGCPPDKSVMIDSMFEDVSSDDDDAISVTSLSEFVRGQIEKIDLSKNTLKYILNYSSQAINDITFKEITEKLIPLLPESEGRIIIDFSFNGLTLESLPFIKQWLDKPAVAYVNLNGNSSLAKRGIKDVCSTLYAALEGTPAEKKERIRQYLSKLIYLPDYYLTTAKRRVKLYNELQAKDYLPGDWDARHRDFYKIVKNLEEFVPTEEEYRDAKDESANSSDLE